MFLLPVASPVFLLAIYFLFPTPEPGPWPYGQEPLAVEGLCMIAALPHIILTIASCVMSLWLIRDYILRMVYLLLSFIFAIMIVLVAVELSMSKAGKWL